ncbi:TIGR04282 family arsenosugar biosynthesis glycosyltransferase [Azospirillum halopraeferens]|uniref:TIGR04282 family arsenosugar biosynthesis glycosyltransferase n=1 Tax=Azospirillum halopraeferens TaxID=34010 RepID=UPI0004030F6E|nr:TIGR04282 family arsenosugar biosynthesis glycosyltransferase [Azospirillum halopraeferens]
MMRNHLVIFARQPRLGRVKRRLAAGVGDVAALRFYRTTLTDLLRRVGHDPRWTLWLAVTPDRAAGGRGWPREARRARILLQDGGDLGARMVRPWRTLPPGRVVVVGSDIPDVDAGRVAAAFRVLGRCAYVFGPAEDGGYWLVGARRRAPPPPGLFAGVRWSTAHALADSLATLPRGATVGFVDTLADVDDAAALARRRDRPVTKS